MTNRVDHFLGLFQKLNSLFIFGNDRCLIPLQVLFGPEDWIISHVLTGIHAAWEAVNIAMFLLGAKTVANALAKAHQRGRLHVIIVTCTLRTMKEQAALYAWEREDIGEVNSLRRLAGMPFPNGGQQDRHPCKAGQFQPVCDLFLPPTHALPDLSDFSQTAGNLAY